jgi:hypothetical protein
MARGRGICASVVIAAVMMFTLTLQVTGEMKQTGIRAFTDGSCRNHL